MNAIVLRCGCQVTEKGEYIVCDRCRNCRECNSVSKLHPFGGDRIMELKTL